MSAAITLSKVSKRYEASAEVIRDASVSFKENELCVIAGRTGAGKSQLAHLAAGIVEPTSGTVERSTEVAVVLQQARAQILGDTVYEDVALGVRMQGRREEVVRSETLRALEALGIAELANRDPWELSGGEVRLLAIATALARRCRVLITDEPFSNLDYPATRRVLERLIALRSSGMGVVIVTHEVDKVLAHADRLVLMKAGAIAFDGKPIDAAPIFGDCGLRPLGNGTKEEIEQRIMAMSRLDNYEAT